MAYLENYWTEFHETFSVDAFWSEDELFNFWSQKAKCQGHSMTRGPVGRGIQSPMLCQVVVSSVHVQYMYRSFCVNDEHITVNCISHLGTPVVNRSVKDFQTVYYIRLHLYGSSTLILVCILTP